MQVTGQVLRAVQPHQDKVLPVELVQIEAVVAAVVVVVAVQAALAQLQHLLQPVMAE